MRRVASLLAALLLATSVLAGAGAAQASDHEGFVYEGDQLVLHNGPGQNVTGQTDLEPGTVVQVSVESTNPKEPFVSRPEAVVRADGSFTANFSLDALAPEPETDLEVSATVVGTGETIDEVTAEVYPCNGQCPDETIASGPDEEPTETSGESAGDLLAQGVITVEQGDTATIPVVLDNASTVTVAIGSDGVNYRINATVSDGNGDGRVDLLFNTTAAGNEGETLSVENSSDSLTITDDEDKIGDILDPAGYDLHLYRGTSTDEVASMGTLQILSGSVDSDDMQDLELENDVITTYSGEAAPLNLTLTDGERATLRIMHDDMDFSVTATVQDGNGDDRIPLVFDTAVGSVETPIRTVQDADAVVDTNVTRGGVTRLPSSIYAIDLYLGGDATGDKDEIGSLSVQQFPEDGPSSGGGSSAADAAASGDDAGTEGTNATQSTPANGAVLVGGGVVGLAAVLGVATKLFA